MTDLKVTNSNIEEIISRMRAKYKTVDEHDILAFFGGWNNDIWIFESEWFEARYNSFEDLCDDFEEWLYDA